MRADDAGRSVEAERRAILMQQYGLVAAAVVLMLTGAAMLVGGVGEGMAFALIAIGVALTVIQMTGRRREARKAH
jgi:plasmid stability protein